MHDQEAMAEQSSRASKTRKPRIVPFGLSGAHLFGVFRGFLRRHSHELYDELKTLLSKPLAPEVQSARLAIFADDADDGFVSVVLQVSGRAKLPDPLLDVIQSGQTIPLCEYLVGMPHIDVAYRKAGIDVADIVADALREWLTEWWWKAGGWDFPIPIATWVHGDFGELEDRDLTAAGAGGQWGARAPR